MSNPQNPDVLEKIKKLLRVDDSKGATQAEVENAMQAATRLALRHGIDLDEVDTTEEVESNEPIIEETFNPTNGSKVYDNQLPVTHRFIAFILERYFRVSILTVKKWARRADGTEGPTRTIQIFGKKTNVSIAIYVYGFLQREFKTLWRKYRAKTGAEMSSRASFYQGLYWGLDEKLRQTMGVVEKESAKALEHKGTSMAIVLHNESKKIEEAVKASHPRVKYTTHKAETDDMSALYEGQRQGTKININPALK